MAWTAPKTFVATEVLTASEMNTYVRDNTLALYPTWTAWTPTFTGFSADPTGVVARYCLVGKLCHISVFMASSGTSSSDLFRLTLPFTAATVSGMAWRNSLAFYEEGATSYRGEGYVTIASGNDYASLWNLTASWATSGNKRADFQMFYEVA